MTFFYQEETLEVCTAIVVPNGQKFLLLVFISIMVSLEKILFYFLKLNWTGFREVQLTGHLTEIEIYPDFLDAISSF